MADFGVKVSRAGYPVLTAADNQLLYSSAFPTLPIFLTGTLSAGASVNHNLGYYPAFGFNMYTTHFDGDGITTMGSYTGGINITCSTTTLTNGSSNDIRYFIFALDITEDYTAANVITTPATQATPDQDFGFKLSSQGNDVKTASYKDLISFSGVTIAGYGARMVLVHKIGHQDNIASTTTTNFSHNLGYVPMFFFFIKNHSDSAYAQNYMRIDFGTNNIPLKVTASSSQLTLLNNTPDSLDVAYVIFKDPF